VRRVEHDLVVGVGVNRAHEALDPAELLDDRADGVAKQFVVHDAFEIT